MYYRSSERALQNPIIFFQGAIISLDFKHASADAFQNPTTVFEGVIISYDLKQQVLIKLPPKEQKSSGLAVNWEETSVTYWINKKPFINSSEYQFMLGMHKMTGVGGAITNDVLKFRKVMKFEHLYIATCFSQMYLSSIEKDHY